MPRAKLLQFVAPNDGPAIWLPATEGLWEWRCLTLFPSDLIPQAMGAKLLLVRGPGPREDGALCLPVVESEGRVLPDLSQSPAAQVKSCRELPAGYWTFIRPLQEGDPSIPGA